MQLLNRVREAVMKLLKLKDAKVLGCDMSSYMASAIDQWDKLFYLIDQPKHSLKLANTVTSYMATLATAELMLDAGPGVRGDWIRQQAHENLLPSLIDAVQLAGVGGMAAIKPYVQGGSIYAEIIPRSRIFPRRWGPNHRIASGFLTDYDKVQNHPAVKVESFDLQPDGLHIANKVYRLKDGGIMGEELPLTAVERWAGLEPEYTINGVDRPHFGLIRMPFVNTVDGSEYPISLYANALDSIMQLDQTYYDFCWERDTGKRRMILDRSAAIKDPINGKSAIPFHDLASDYYMTIDMPDEKPWEDVYKRQYLP